MLDKQTILIKTKENMRNIIDTLSLDNLEEVQNSITTNFDFLSSLFRLTLLSQYKTTNYESEIKETNTISATEQPNAGEKLYRFERKLKGGILPDLNGGYFIPETMVRDMSLAHGDKLRISREIVESDMSDNSFKRYWFEVVERSNEGDAWNRVELKHCIVEKDFGELIVRKQMSGQDIKLNGISHSFVLKAGDVQDLAVREGDVIDISFYENKPDTVRVLWKHDIRGSRSETTLKNKPMATRSSAKTDDRSEKEIVKREVLQGKHVTVVGATIKESSYRDILEPHGATVVTLSGRETKSRLRAAIKKADIVVIAIAHCGHGGSKAAVPLCKENKIPFVVLDSMGNTSFVEAVEKKLQEELQTA